MLTWAVILFAVAAVGGVTLISIRARRPEVPLGLAVAHGLAAATALVLLLLAVLGGGTPGLATVALVVFVAAALGGFVLFASHLRRGTFPLGLALAHGAAAVLAFVLLLAGLYL